MEMDAVPIDAVQQAAQLGRLDFASLLLAMVAVLIALAAVFAFLNLRRVARDRATEVAERISGEIAEKAANKYLREELPNILSSNLELFGSVRDHSADGIADTQQRGGAD